MLLTSESWAPPGRLRELGNKQEIFETEILKSSGERDLPRSQTNGGMMPGSEKKYQPPLPFRNFRWRVPDTESVGERGKGYRMGWASLVAQNLVNNLHANAGDQGSIPGLGRSPGEGNGNPFQYSCLENPMDSGA